MLRRGVFLLRELYGRQLRRTYLTSLPSELWLAKASLSNHRLEQCSALLRSDALNLTQTRHHWRPTRSKRAPPTKHVSFEYSGDLDMSMGDVDLSTPKPGYEAIPELVEADENVRRIFSLEYCTHADVVQKYVDELLKKVKDHPADIRSLEVQIARLTIQIRNNIRHCLRFRNDKINKNRLWKSISTRRILLGQLAMEDIDKYNWLLDQLRLKYIERDPNYRKPSKADVRRQKVDEAVAATVQAKTEQLWQAFKKERAKFDEYKEKELKDIECSLRELGIKDEDMTSLEKTLEALGHGDMMPRAKPFIPLHKRRFEKQKEIKAPMKKAADTETLHAYGFLTPEELSHYPDTTNK